MDDHTGRESGGFDERDIEMSGKWDQLKGQLRKKWGDLTDDELDRVKGEKTKMIGLLKEKFHLSDDEARRELGDWSV